MGRREPETVSIYTYLELRDGPACQGCGVLPPPAHERDHIDGDPTNTDLTNLRLLCMRCNRPGRPSGGKAAENGGSATPQIGPSATSRHAAQIQNGHHPDTVSIPMREKDNFTFTLRRSIDLQAGSTELKLSDIYEERWVLWMEAMLDRDGFIPKAEAINSGAYIAGAHTGTTRRYLDKYCGLEGPYQETRDQQLHTPLIVRKPRPRRMTLIKLPLASRKYSIPQTTLRRKRDAGEIGRMNGSLYEEDVAELARERNGNH